MASSGFSIAISATDGASAKIDAINKRLAAMNAPVDRVQKSLAKFADLSGINKLRDGLAGMANAGLDVFRNIMRIVEPLAAITGAASLAGIAAMVARWGEFGTKLMFSAQRMGMASDQLMTLQNAGRLAGVSADTMTAGLTALNDNLTKAANGLAPEATMAFNYLGFSIRDAHGHVKSAAEALPELQEKLRAIQNPTIRAQVATMLFGGAAEALIPYLSRSKEELDAYTAAAKRHGVMTEAQVWLADKLRRAQTNVTESVEGFGNALSAVLSPILTKTLEQFSAWIDRMRPLVAAGVDVMVQNLSKWLDSINWDKVQQGFLDFFEGVVTVTAAVGGLMGAAKLFLAYMVGKWTIGLLVTLARIVTSFQVLTAAIGLGQTAALGMLGTFTSILAAVTAIAALAKLGSDAETPENREKIEQNRRDRGSGLGPSTMTPQDGYGVDGRPLQPSGPALPGVPYQAGDILKSMHITPGQYDAFKSSVAGIEHARYNQMGGSSGRFAGRYQMGSTEIAETAGRLDVPVPSQREFLTNPGMQERFFEAYTAGHHATLMATSAKYRAMTPAQQLAVDAYAHNQGAKGAADWLDSGRSGKDAFGTSGSAYSDAAKRNLSNVPPPQVVQAPAANINGGTGSPPATASAGTIKGSAAIDLTLRGFPRDTRTTATTSGDLFGAPRIEKVMDVANT